MASRVDVGVRRPASAADEGLHRLATRSHRPYTEPPLTAGPAGLCTALKQSRTRGFPTLCSALSEAAASMWRDEAPLGLFATPFACCSRTVSLLFAWYSRVRDNICFTLSTAPLSGRSRWDKGPASSGSDVIQAFSPCTAIRPLSGSSTPLAKQALRAVLPRHREARRLPAALQLQNPDSDPRQHRQPHEPSPLSSRGREGEV